ncbi:MAG: AGE family epimerase/isomerase [Acidimicrobiia bacterium]|nr:AGE family epimerase/isomerase [Acidimicrobiia bacterium]
MNEPVTSLSVGSRVRAGVATWVVVLVALRLLVLQPERCDPPTVAEVEESAVAAVNWFVRNQNLDGTWLYRYNVETNMDLGGYNLSRHSGVTLSLYQAAAAGIPGAWESAERGSRYLAGLLVAANDGRAVNEQGSEVAIGPSALWALALGERRLTTGDPAYDDVLRDLGRFLEGQIEENGAVSERWDRSADRLVPGAYSPFFTGEAYFALARLERLFPDERWEGAADRVGRYLAVERDEAEDRFPAVSDHWAAYGLAETARWRALTAAEADYAGRLGGIFGPQIRYASQRTESWFTHRTRGRRTLGAGLGTLGEGTTSLWVLAGIEPAAGDLRAAAGERSACVAAMLIERQIDPTEARAYEDARRSAGSWVQFGVTQMDDQQHALSALLRTLPILEAAL